MRETPTKTQEVPFSLEKIIQSMPEQAYVLSNEGRLLTWNKNVEIISGYSGDELRNKFVAEFVHKDDKAWVVEKFIELLVNDDNKKTAVEYSLQTKSGKLIPVIALRSLLIVNDKKFVAGIVIDISKLKNNKEKLDTYIAEITHVKNQLLDHYHKIDQLNHAKIELKERLFINAKEFSNKLINSLPGIFYLYEKIDGNFFLKRWNDNLESRLGYSAEELLNMQPYQFFNKKVYRKVNKAIMQIFTTGSTQIKAPMLFKNDEEIPYLFEAYLFENKDSLYFMGVGLYISIQHNLEQKQKLQESEKRKEKKILEATKRELVATALQISKTSKIIKNTLKQIDRLLEKHSETEIFDDLIDIRKDLKSQSTVQDNWEIFKLRFTEIHKDFFNNLKVKHPTLTKTELKFCAYLRIHLTSSQISSVLNVTNEAIKKTRYRIRKKLGLAREDSLEDYIAKF